MRVLLVGNFEPDGQQSMARYAAWLERSLTARGVQVKLVAPHPCFARLARNATARKYLGYIDKFLIFPPNLVRAARKYDLVHVLDHSNSMYLRFVRRTPNLITCHDLLAVRAAQGEFAETRTGWSGRLLQRWIVSGLRGADHVLCVSHKTATDLQAVTGKTGDRVIVAYNALNWRYAPGVELSTELRSQLGLERGQRYFLHVGGNGWYKNRLGVIRIFAQMSSMQEFATARLILAGKRLSTEMRALISQSGLRGSVIEAVNVSNVDLQALYCNAVALIFPSLEEGFGWPILEAQACGCPVITSDREPMTEVAGKAAIFVDPRNAEAAAATIAAGLKYGEQLRVDGFRNLARFDEHKILDEYCAYYERILSSSRF